MEIGKLFQNIILPAVTAATAVMVGWLNYSIGRLDHELKSRITDVDIAVKRETTDRDTLTSEREFGFRIYNLVQESLEAESEKKQEVARQFVIVMVDGELRRRLLGVLEEGGTQAVQESTARILEKERAFEAETTQRAEPRATTPTFDWEDWDYDVFWCESSGESAKTQAELMVSALIGEGAKGRIRARELPDSVNAKPGYGVSGYEIRRAEDEKEQADALKTLGDRALAESGYSANFSFQPTSTRTKWYVSAFICP